MNLTRYNSFALDHAFARAGRAVPDVYLADEVDAEVAILRAERDRFRTAIDRCVNHVFELDREGVTVEETLRAALAK